MTVMVKSCLFDLYASVLKTSSIDSKECGGQQANLCGFPSGDIDEVNNCKLTCVFSH